MAFGAAVTIGENQLVVAILGAWSVKQRKPGVRHVPPFGQGIRHDLGNWYGAALSILDANCLAVVSFLINSESAVRQVKVAEPSVRDFPFPRSGVKEKHEP